MKKIYLVLFISLSFFTVGYGDSNKRRSQILSIVDSEILEVRKISSKYNHKNPKLLLRIAELYFEKARIVKDGEQEKFRDIPPRKRARTKKSSYFQKSRRYFVKAQKLTQGILKKFKRFEPKENIYFILASNAKEFRKKRDMKKYFGLALKKSKRGSEIYKRSSLALAEIYYNEKKYGRAANFYAGGLKGKRDKWWTRDSYNMAWAYYKQKKYDQALDLMKDVYRQSSNSKYVNMRKQAERDIGVFYVSAGDATGGSRFFKSIGKNPTSQLIRLAQKLMDQEKIIEAENILLEARKSTKKEVETVKINLILLEIYKKSSNYKKHIQVSQRLITFDSENGIKKKQREVLLYQLKYMVGVLQKKIIRASKKPNKKSNKNILKNSDLAAKYFSMISVYEKNKSAKYLYLKAETYYAAKEMKKAYKSYFNSLSYSKNERDRKYTKLAIDGMLAVLASPHLSKKIKKKYYISAYKEYLKLDRKSKRADKIYQRIFNEYFKKKDFSSAENVLNSYQKNFSRNIETMEAMVAKIMDFYKKSNDNSNFLRWVKKIESGKYNVSQKYTKNMKDILVSMKFKNVENLSKKGNKKKALEGYLVIYNSSNSSRGDRKNAAHNIAVIYFELGYADKIYEWTKKVVSLMNFKDLSLYGKTYLAISSELFNMQNFRKSADLSEIIYNKVCRKRMKQKDALYKNSYIVYLAMGDITSAMRVISSGENCGISSNILREAQFELLTVLSRRQEWKKFEFHLKKIKNKADLSGRVIALMAKLRDAYRDFSYQGQVIRLEKEMEFIFKKSTRAKRKISTDSRWVIAEMRLRKMLDTVKNFHGIKLTFPLKTFDSRLEKKLSLLDKISLSAKSVFNTRSGRGSIRAYQLIIESYQRLVREIKNVDVKKQDKGFIKDFRKAMAQVEGSLLKKSNSYLKQAQKIIAEGKVLSPQSYWFISQNRIPFNVGYYFTGKGIIMDRLGKE